MTSSDGMILKTWLSQLRWNCRGQRVVCDARVGMAAHHEQVIRRWFTNRWIMILLDDVQDDNDEDGEDDEQDGRVIRCASPRGG